MPSFVQSLQAESMVIDMGGYEMKYGMASSSTDVVARVRTCIGLGPEQRPLIGPHLPDDHGEIILVAPSGYPEKMEVAEKLWAYAFEQQPKGWDSHEHPTLLAVPPKIPRDVLELVVQTWFESFNVPLFYCLPAPVATLYNVGRTHGFVLDVGEAGTTATPVSEGMVLKYGVQTEALGGRQATEYCAKLLKDALPSSPITWKAAEAVKRQAARCCASYRDALSGHANPTVAGARTFGATLDREVEVPLPDGKTLKMQMGKDRLMIGELLFRPTYQPHSRGLLSVPQVLWNSIQKVPHCLSRELISSVVVCGGTSLMDGFADRLLSEIDCISPTQLKPRVTFSRDRADTVWRGAALAATLPQFEKLWITKQDYNECGPTVIHR